MSAVATLNALPPRGKRHFDEMAVDYTPPPGKRARTLAALRHVFPPSSPPSDARMVLDREKTPPPAVPPPQPQLDTLSALSRHIPRRLRRLVSKLSSGEVSFDDKIISVNEVRDIVTSALEERETRLREEFTQLLHERLAEQFNDFTRFNQDYVKRTLRGRDESYLS